VPAGTAAHPPPTTAAPPKRPTRTALRHLSGLATATACSQTDAMTATTRMAPSLTTGHQPTTTTPRPADIRCGLQGICANSPLLSLSHLLDTGLCHMILPHNSSNRTLNRPTHMQARPEPLYCGTCKAQACSGQILTACMQCCTTYHITCANVTLGEEGQTWICHKCDMDLRVRSAISPCHAHHTHD